MDGTHNTAPFHLGGRDDAGSCVGAMDNVGVWDRVLTPNEIQTPAVAEPATGTLIGVGDVMLLSRRRRGESSQRTFQVHWGTVIAARKDHTQQRKLRLAASTQATGSSLSLFALHTEHAPALPICAIGSAVRRRGGMDSTRVGCTPPRGQNRWNRAYPEGQRDARGSIAAMMGVVRAMAPCGGGLGWRR